MSLPETSDSPPRRIPLEVKLRVRDVFGREKCYAMTWEAVEERGPDGGSSGLTLTTGLTDVDGAGVRAECTVRVGL